MGVSRPTLAGPWRQAKGLVVAHPVPPKPCSSVHASSPTFDASLAETSLRDTRTVPPPIVQPAPGSRLPTASAAVDLRAPVRSGTAAPGAAPRAGGASAARRLSS